MDLMPLLQRMMYMCDEQMWRHLQLLKTLAL